MIVKHKKLARQGGACRSTAFTMVELLTVLVIIAILVALLIPAVAMVRNMAKETQQKAQLTTIEMALTAFRNDYGDYPQSSWDRPPGDYCGAQKLSEALVGWDLMGFHPKSAWRADGEGKNSRDETYDPDKNRDDNPNDGTPDTLKERKGPYLELATTNVFRLNQLFDDTGTRLAEDTFVLCDVFGARRITLAAGNIVKAGTPILYYRANTSSKDHITNPQYDKRIYNVLDNRFLVELKKVTTAGTADEVHPLEDNSNRYKAFYDFITDTKVEVPWPHRPDSYILITAGVDGLYGTSDDIRNF